MMIIGFLFVENGRWPIPNAQIKKGALSISPTTSMLIMTIVIHGMLRHVTGVSENVWIGLFGPLRLQLLEESCLSRRLVLLLCSLLYIGLRTTVSTRFHPDVQQSSEASCGLFPKHFSALCTWHCSSRRDSTPVRIPHMARRW
jgi:hypothetical protein